MLSGVSRVTLLFLHGTSEIKRGQRNDLSHRVSRVETNRSIFILNQKAKPENLVLGRSGQLTSLDEMIQSQIAYQPLRHDNINTMTPRSQL